ncbi:MULTISPECIES: hypothetical protein [unclassified Pseudoalteromonas]|jgi:hypothetical protein|uniref:hypothetical protein n=1 Tax=unclassified Pseudoalteromonas TaxID=194690 RepID=UPI0025744316|nr:hypothetical protein [Pseudoalteromonas sp. MM1]BED88811.1 hypothetical protein PspMM1_12790 [Pseudoalteromonas sp. MM1]
MNSSLTTSQLKPMPRAVHFRANSNQVTAATGTASNTNFAPQSLQSKQEQVQECVVILSNN